MDRNENAALRGNLVQLARLALKGESKQVTAFVRRLGRTLMKEHPDTADALMQMAGAGMAMRSGAEDVRAKGTRLVPVDQESRWDLLRIETAPHVPPPVLSSAVESRIEQIIAERQRLHDLMDADLEPSRTILFTGPPGVGKTLSAYWIAERLNKPLFILDLASVMSSFLGKTGNNVRAVLEYAKSNDGILLLDEFDSVAKRRNDDSEVGELKRLVTVILQEIDRWPSDRLLIAATNHGELLDPAVWRRFDAVIDFSLPDRDGLERLLERELVDVAEPIWASALSVIFRGHSFSDVTRSILHIRRQALISNQSVNIHMMDFVKEHVAGLSKADLKSLSCDMESANIPQRRISEITGLSRDTIRRARRIEVEDGRTD